MSEVIVSDYVPRPQALAFHARAQRFSVLVMHRRFGKTVACVNDIIDKAVQNTRSFPPPLYAYIAPYYAQAKRVAWTYLKYYTRGIAAQVRESELTVILHSGARISLYGADNPDALRGSYLDGCVIDEYGDVQPRLFSEIVLPMLADYKGWCVFIGTPKGKNHFFDLWESANASGDWYTLLMPATESGVIDAAELELIRTSPGSDESTFEQEMLCSFTSANKGAYYGRHLNDLELAGGMGCFPYDPSREVLTAWDIGRSDDTAIWFFQTDGKLIHVIDFYSGAGLDVTEALAVLESKPYAYGTFFLPHDARNRTFSGPKSARDQFAEAGCRTFIVPNLSVQDGIQAVRAMLPDVRFNVASKDVLDGVRALRAYEREWDDAKGMFRVTPKHNWASHPADAFRMLALSMNKYHQARGARVLRTVENKRPDVAGNVLTLDALYAERKKAQAGAFRRV